MSAYFLGNMEWNCFKKGFKILMAFVIYNFMVLPEDKEVERQ